MLDVNMTPEVPQSSVTFLLFGNQRVYFASTCEVGGEDETVGVVVIDGLEDVMWQVDGLDHPLALDRDGVWDLASVTMIALEELPVPIVE